MRPIILTTLIILILFFPLYSLATGVGGFYAVSVPSVKLLVDDTAYDTKVSLVGFGGKFWYNPLPIFSVDGFFSYQPKYAVKDYSDLSLSMMGFGGGGSVNLPLVIVEPYASAGMGAYISKIKWGEDSFSSTDFGTYFGGGLRFGHMIKFDINPVYTIVFGDNGEKLKFFDLRFGADFSF